MRRRIEAAENGVRDKRQVGQRRIEEARRACARMIARVEDEQRAPEGGRVVSWRRPGLHLDARPRGSGVRSSFLCS